MAVEFALILPILFVLAFGIITAGLSYTHALGLTNAVREGSRFGATAAFDPATPDVWTAAVLERTRQLQFDDKPTESDPNVKATAVCVELYKQGTGPLASSCHQGEGSVDPPLDVSAAPDVPAGLSVNDCVVRVWTARNFTIQIIVGPAMESTMVRGSVARYERTC